MEGLLYTAKGICSFQHNADSTAMPHSLHARSVVIGQLLQDDDSWFPSREDDDWQDHNHQG